MNFKKTIYKLLLSSTFIPLIYVFLGGMKMPDDMVYLSAFVYGHGVILLLHENILTFFAIEKAFLPRIVVMGLLSAGFLYIMDMVLPGFSIEELSFSKIDLGFLTINPIGMSKYATIGTFSALSSLLYVLFLKLRE